MEFIACQVREYLAMLGVRSLAEAIGQAELLTQAEAAGHQKAAFLDLAPLLHVPGLPPGTARRRTRRQESQLHLALDNTLIQLADGALADGSAVRLELPVRNVNRAVGTMLGSEVTRRWGGQGLPGRHDHGRAARIGRAVTRRLPARRHHDQADRRRQRLRRQGAVRRPRNHRS